MRYCVLLVFITLMVVACQEESPAATALPNATATQAASPTPVPPTVVIERATLPPTWTPLPGGGQVTSNQSEARSTNTPRPTVTLRPGEATLPPTWTPPPTVERQSGGSTNLDYDAAATAAAAPRTATPTIPPPDALCFIFEPDENANRAGETTFSNQAVTIFWKPIPVPGYSYSVKLFHENGVQVLEQITEGSSFTIPEGVLVSGNAVYGWEIQPVLNLELTCFPITGEIYVLPASQ